MTDGRIMFGLWVLALAFLLGIVLTSCRSEKPTISTEFVTPPGPSVDRIAAEVHAEVNRRRVDANLPPLNWNDHLYALAQGHSGDMAEHRFLGHAGSDGRSPLDRKVAAGITCGIGENVGVSLRGPAIVRTIVDAWMASEGHRQNILGTRWKSTGVGIGLSDRVYFTQVFCAEEES